MAGAVNDNHYSYRLYADPAMAASTRCGSAAPSARCSPRTRPDCVVFGPVEGRPSDVGTARARPSDWPGAEPASRPRRLGRDVARGEARASRPVWATFEVGGAHRLAHPDRGRLRRQPEGAATRQTGGNASRNYYRVSDNRVVFDYPTALSAAALQAYGRRLAARRPSVRPTVLSRPTSGGGGGRRFPRRAGAPAVRPAHRAHKALDRGPTVAVEKALAAVGLLRLLGSPVTVAICTLVTVRWVTAATWRATSEPGTSARAVQ
jgi:hypothetical protein